MRKRKPKNYWKNYKNITATIKKNQSYSDWKSKNTAAYDFLCRNHNVKKRIINDYFKKSYCLTKKRLSYTDFIKIAKKYNSMKEWWLKDKSSQNYFYKMKKNKELSNFQVKKILNHMNKKHYYSFEECFLLASKFKRKFDWRIGHVQSYKKAFSIPSWYKKCTKHMPVADKMDVSNSEIYKFHPLFLNNI